MSYADDVFINMCKDILENGMMAKRMVNITESDVREWEEINGFKYNYMPRIVTKNNE